jgi:hypothetical protein
LSDLKRYEEELAKRLKELSSPNKDQVWQKIENLLDKDDDKGGAVAFPGNLPKTLLGLFLLLASIGIVWFAYSQLSVSPATKNDNNKSALKDGYAKKEIAGIEKNNITPAGLNNKITDNIQLQNEKDIAGNNSLKNNKSVAVENKIVNNYDNENKQKIIAKPHSIIATKNKTSFNAVDANVGDDQPQQLTDTETRSVDSNKNVVTKTAVVTSIADTVAKKDNKVITPVGKVIKTDSSVITKKKKRLYWSAGLAEQQAVNLDCHCFYTTSPYTANIKASDYIPSAYVRSYHQKKWFLQAEFKYAAPQYINAFTYKVTVQNLPFNDVVTSYTLKKVYSHQVAASFHYFILPNLSVGTGIIYNLFSAADIQKDVRQKQYESAKDLLVGSININDKEDSNFDSHMKNDLQWLLETQYKWKQLSVGVNYAIGLNPYVNYTDPFSGLPGQNKKNALNIFIRYELWRSKSR